LCKKTLEDIAEMTRRIPALQTERLIIRELTLDDLVSINNVLNESFDSEVPMEERERWLQWTVLGYEMFAMLDQPHYGERAVVSKETGEIIGAVGIVQYLFTDDKLGRIIATTGYENLPSQRVMQKLGMTIQRLEKPQPPDQFVVGVLENDTPPQAEHRCPLVN
jgi:RimJ/RimL family protein N-acetyltransferase